MRSKFATVQSSSQLLAGKLRYVILNKEQQCTHSLIIRIVFIKLDHTETSKSNCKSTVSNKVTVKVKIQASIHHTETSEQLCSF
jgi:hypothetical protein